MYLVTAENHEDIYRNEEISKIVMSTLTSPTAGKVISLAESGYSNFKNRFYVAFEGEKIVGILGVSKVDHGKCSILHFGVAADEDIMVTGKNMINLFKDERGEILEIYVETNSGLVDFYKSCGFKDDKRKFASDTDIAVEKYPLKLKVRNVKL